MANWKSEVYLADLFTDEEKGTMTINEIGKETAKRLKLNKYKDHILDIIERFECVESVGDYDYTLQDLYDYGDDSHKIWINTCFPKKEDKQ
jgi:hypothetical protein